MGEKSGFQPVITYPHEPTKENTLFLLCSGKVRYEIEGLMKENQNFGRRACILVLEELLPFPYENLRAILEKANKSAKVVNQNYHS
jgi:2-oxoglutarate dehydrogenase complex dehydrogenase (E1) component-like enzyme